MATEIDPATGIAATGGIIGSVPLIWAIIRRIKGDLRVDRNDQAQDSFRDLLLKETKELRERADKFAQERNLAQVEVARLTSDLKHANDQVKELEAEVDELKDKLKLHENPLLPTLGSV